jgi:hypothetical protein
MFHWRKQNIVETFGRICIGDSSKTSVFTFPPHLFLHIFLTGWPSGTSLKVLDLSHFSRILLEPYQLYCPVLSPIDKTICLSYLRYVSSKLSKLGPKHSNTLDGNMKKPTVYVLNSQV